MIPDHIRKLRQHVGNEMLLVPSVTALIRNDEDQILAVKLNDEKMWTLPGGLLELGESPVDALIREVREECGVTVEPISVLGIFGGFDGFRRTYSNGNRIECLEILFECEISSGGVNASDSEIIEAKFRSPNKLQNWMYPISLLKILEAAKNRKIMMTFQGNELYL